MEKPHTKFSELNRQEKTEHIFEYYKLHMIAAVAVILVIGWMLNHYIINPPAKTGLDIAVFTTDYNVTGLQEWGELLTPLVIEAGVNEEVFVEHVYSGVDSDPQVEMAMQAKLAAKIQMNEMDICIFEGDTYLEFFQEKVLRNLEDIISGIDLSAYPLVSNQDIISLYPGIEDIEDFQIEGDLESVILIDITNSAQIRERVTTEKPLYMCVFTNSQHIDEIKKWLAYIAE